MYCSDNGGEEHQESFINCEIKLPDCEGQGKLKGLQFQTFKVTWSEPEGLMKHCPLHDTNNFPHTRVMPCCAECVEEDCTETNWKDEGDCVCPAGKQKQVKKCIFPNNCPNSDKEPLREEQFVSCKDECEKCDLGPWQNTGKCTCDTGECPIQPKDCEMSEWKNVGMFRNQKVVVFRIIIIIKI